MSDSVRITRPRACDYCQSAADLVAKTTNELEVVNVSPATVDGRTKHGHWANMCDDHWKIHGVGRLGTGYGQRLILDPA